MCRSIKTLRSYDTPVPLEDIEAAALQYVRKISGYRKPSRANAEVFDRAVTEITAVSRTLLDNLVVRPPAPGTDTAA
jgi:hypothetical protein